MPKLIMSLAIAFLVGITIGGCAELTAARTQLISDTNKLSSEIKPSSQIPMWTNTADRSGGE